MITGIFVVALFLQVNCAPWNSTTVAMTTLDQQTGETTKMPTTTTMIAATTPSTRPTTGTITSISASTEDFISNDDNNVYNDDSSDYDTIFPSPNETISLIDIFKNASSPSDILQSIINQLQNSRNTNNTFNSSSTSGDSPLYFGDIGSFYEYSDIISAILNGVSDFDKNGTDISNAPGEDNPFSCIELLNHGWNTDYKFNSEQFSEAMCRCLGVCSYYVEPSEELQELGKKWVLHPFSQANIQRFFAIIIAYVIIFLVGVTGNILTLVGLSTWMKQQSPTYGFIMSLACSDLLSLCVCLPVRISEYFHFGSFFNVIICKVSYYIRNALMICSVLTLTVISFERFYAICKPFIVQYLCTWSRARKLILSTWILSFGLAVPTYFEMKYYYKTSGYHECLPQSKNDWELYLYFSYITGVLFVLPSFIMSYTYSRSCYVLWRSTSIAMKLKGMDAKVDCAQDKSKQKQDSEDIQGRKRVVRGLICVVTLFILCWGPTLVIHLLIGLNISMQGQNEILLGLDTLTYISSAVNPYIFMTMSSQFSEPIIQRLLKFGQKKSEMTTKETTMSMTTDMTSAAHVTVVTSPKKF